MFQWTRRQIRRVYRFFRILPLAISNLGLYGFVRELIHHFFFHGLHGVKTFGRNFWLEIERRNNLNCQDDPDSKCAELSKYYDDLSEPSRFALALRLSSLFPGALSSHLKKGYVILAPDYVVSSAGINCLYRLADDLNRRGYPTFMTLTGKGHPTAIAPIVSMETAKLLAAYGYTAIYAETYTGNPLNAKNVARWVLNRPGLLGGDEIYDEKELVFYYSDLYLPYIKNTVQGKLYMPTIDQTIFYPPTEPDFPRSLSCYYVGKSKFTDHHFDKEKAFEITRETPPKKELGKIPIVIYSQTKTNTPVNSYSLPVLPASAPARSTYLPSVTSRSHSSSDSDSDVDLRTKDKSDSEEDIFQMDDVIKTGNPLSRFNK